MSCASPPHGLSTTWSLHSPPHGLSTTWSLYHTVSPPHGLSTTCLCSSTRVTLTLRCCIILQIGALLERWEMFIAYTFIAQL